MSVGLSVCLRRSIFCEPHTQTSPNFCAYRSRLFVGPPLAALQYVTTYLRYRYKVNITTENNER